MNVIILSAGRSKRMGTLSKNLPKPLFHINKVPIIVRLIQQLLKYDNVNKIIVVGGYKYDKLEFLNSLNRKVKTIYNPCWKDKNNAYSYLIGSYLVDNIEDILLIEADCIFSNELMDNIMYEAKNKSNAIFCDYMEGYSGSKITIGKKNKIIKMEIQKGKRRNNENELKSIGVMKLSYLKRLLLTKSIIEATEKQYKDYIDIFVSKLAIKYGDFEAVNCNGHKWIEIDTPAEYNKAKKIFS